MKKIILYIFLSILIAINIFLISLKPNQETPQNEKKKEMIYRLSSETMVENNFCKLNNIVGYWGTKVENKLYLKDIIKEDCLVLLLSGNMCNVCIDFAIDKVQKIFPDYSKNEKIILLSYNMNSRLKDNYYGKKIFSYSYGELGLKIEKYHEPYYFILNKEMDVKMFFIPDKLYPELTEKYLKKVKNYITE